MIHWKQFVLAPAAALCGLIATGAWAADSPEQLTLSDLAHRPDRWPSQVALASDGNFGGRSHAKGESLKLVDFDGQTVVLSAAADQQIGVSADNCDLLEAANAMWAKLTPEQRAVDLAAIASDVSLWPPKVATQVAFQISTGGVVPVGTECEVLAVTQKGLDLAIAKPVPARLQALPGQTDLLARARERVGVAPDKRPSRIAAALRGGLVDAKGQAYEGDSSDRAKLFVLYYGASWCAPCRKFSPTFVKFIKENSAANPQMSVAMLSADKEPAKMLGYMQAEKMPFPVMPNATLIENGVLLSFKGNGIPQMVVTDRDGKVLANSFENNQYVGPERTLMELKKILASGVAK